MRNTQQKLSRSTASRTRVTKSLKQKCDQRPNKVRFFTDKSKAQEVTKELFKRLEKRGVHVLPKGGGKGPALAYLLNELKAEGKLPVKILVCGDSGNDKELFTILNVCNSQDSRGIIRVEWRVCERQCKDNPREWRRGDVENCEAYVASLKASCHPGGVFVHPYGAEKSLRDTIDELGKNHGDKKDKKFRIWTDQVLATDATPRTWIVKLNKWEQTGN
uniref:Sucrose phosphatase-like domain-containing protein n=1 Tax=Brassica oleracea var. oleracea TaxID=109376 RepID=A0A0D3CDJ7_BRAOL